MMGYVFTMTKMVMEYAMAKTIVSVKSMSVGFAMVQERFMNADVSICLRNLIGAAAETFQKAIVTATEINWMR
jgi:hypothetical protein